jgi:hypothetical protein
LPMCNSSSMKRCTRSIDIFRGKLESFC